MAATKRDYFDNGGIGFNISASFGSPSVTIPNRWLGQSFTPQSSYQITSVRIPIRRKSSDTGHGDMTVSIYEAGLNDNPVFSPLVTGIIANADIPVTGSGSGLAWIEVEFGTLITASKGTTKVIVASFPDATAEYSSANQLTWWGAISSDYELGFTQLSDDGGVNWNDRTAGAFEFRDRGFEVWGQDIVVPVPTPDDLISFPPSERPDDYDPDLFWQPGEWTDPNTYVSPSWGTGYVATGGGRWGQNLVVAGNNKVYYEPFAGV